MLQIIPDILSLVLFSICVLLFSKRTTKNSFHLDFLLLHLVASTLIVLIYKYSQHYGFVNLSITYRSVLFLRLVSIVFFALHVKSAIAGVKSKITFRFYFLLVVFVFFLVLNYFNIYLLDFRSNKNFILNTPITDLFFVSDIVLISFLSQLFYVFYIFYIIKSNFIKTNKKVLKMPYLNWVLLYTFIWLIIIVLINYYYFSSSLLLNNQQFNVYLKILSAVSIVIFILNPRILSYLPLISKINVYNVDTHSNEINKKIDFIITTQKLYLNPDFSLTELVFISQFSNSQIRNAIMANHSMNFRSYLNKFRVLYSEHLIKSNYLNTHSIVALGKESGFNSHQSFFRAFKKLHNMTPGQFRKKYFDNDSS